MVLDQTGQWKDRHSHFSASVMNKHFHADGNITYADEFLKLV